jgi:hypothetical protein
MAAVSFPVAAALILLGLVLLAPACRGWSKGKKRLRDLRKYEFEHRTAGGVVQFKTFEDSEEHARGYAATAVGGGIGCLFMIGVIVTFAGVSLVVIRLLSAL